MNRTTIPKSASQLFAWPGVTSKTWRAAAGKLGSNQMTLSCCARFSTPASPQVSRICTIGTGTCLLPTAMLTFQDLLSTSSGL